MPRTFLAVLLLASSCWLSAGDSGDAPKVAVLRLLDAITSSKAYQAKVDAFKKLSAEADARVKEMDEHLQKLNTAIEALPAGNEKLAGLQEDLESSKARREAFVRRISQDFERKQIAMVRESYQQTVDRLAEFCKGRGIKIVVQAANKDINAPSFVMANLRLEMQTALFYDADQDITDAFIGFINAQPAAVAPAAPAPAGGK